MEDNICKYSHKFPRVLEKEPFQLRDSYPQINRVFRKILYFFKTQEDNRIQEVICHISEGKKIDQSRN